MSNPELWLIAGPNGAGKTTAVQRGPLRRLIPDLRPLNADDRTFRLLRQAGYAGFHDAPQSVLVKTFVHASELTHAEVCEAVAMGHPVCVETVLSTDKYRPLVESVTGQDGIFNLIYVAVRSPEISLARISQRVREGGHDVPADKVVARWHRSLEFLPWFARRASALWVYDNSDSDPGSSPRLIVHGIEGRVRVLEPGAIPDVTRALAELQSR